MEKFRTYANYKPSRVAWLGSVPDIWHSTRLKFECHVNMGQSPSSDDCNIDGIGLPFLQGNAEFSEKHPKAKQYCDVANKIANEGELLLSVRAPVGALNVADQAYGIGRGLCAIAPFQNLEKGFIWWLLPVIKTELDSICTGSTFESVSVEQVENLRFFIPAVSEQYHIADFLCHETAKIDRLIAKQERLIELLKEKRQAVISHAVTKGLNPDTPLKDSGVEWLGEVPAQWETARLRFVVEGGLVNGLFKKKEHFGKGTLLVNVFDIYQEDFVIKPDLLERVAATKEEEKAYQVEPGDIFFVRSSLKLEGVGRSSCAVVVPEPMVFECHLVRARPKKTMMSPRFMNYFLNSTQAVSRLVSLANFVTMATVDQEKIKGVNIPIPPLNDQDEICDYLDRKVQVFDELVNKTGVAVVLLKEHRTALISAAVTGKIDVRGWKIPNTESEKIAQVVSA
jgi:type I restriction enzyme S subunit